MQSIYTTCVFVFFKSILCPVFMYVQVYRIWCWSKEWNDLPEMRQSLQERKGKRENEKHEDRKKTFLKIIIWKVWIDVYCYFLLCFVSPNPNLLFCFDCIFIYSRLPNSRIYIYIFFFVEIIDFYFVWNILLLPFLYCLFWLQFYVSFEFHLLYVYDDYVVL